MKMSARARRWWLVVVFAVRWVSRFVPVATLMRLRAPAGQAPQVGAAVGRVPLVRQPRQGAGHESAPMPHTAT